MVERFKNNIVIEINGDTRDDFNESHFLRVFYRYSVNFILSIETILKFNEVRRLRARVNTHQHRLISRYRYS